jgi:hypothetical protein
MPSMSSLKELVTKTQMEQSFGLLAIYKNY